jgi:outer membrane protein insertion porin family
MRFSPVLLAVFTASATLGFSSPVRAQSETTPPDVIASSNATPATLAIEPIVVPTVIQPEAIAPEFAQAPAEPLPEDTPAAGSQGQSQPGNPPAGTQTPTQETPNQLQLDVTPGESGVDIEIPEAAPQQTVPAPTVPAPTVPAPATPAPTTPPPAGQTPGTTPPTTPTTPAEEPRVLVSEVVISGAEGDLQRQVYDAISTQPGRTTTRSQLQEDINAIFELGFFSNVQAVPTDTPLGVRITFVVQPNPLLRQVQIQGNQVLPASVINDIFSPQYGALLNLNTLQEGIEALNKWYQDNGYVLAQVVGAPRISEDGTVTLDVAEGVIEDIQVRFLDREGQATDENGNPVRGQTREFIITREFATQSGDVFNQQQIEADLQRVYGLGIFEDVRVSLDPGQDPRQVDVIVNVTERNTGSIAAGLGFSSASGLFGTVSFQEQNLGGNNQRIGADIQVGERELLFDASFTDPWIGGDPYRTSYTVNVFNRRSISLIFDGGDEDVDLPNGDRPRVDRLGGGVSFGRPLDEWLGLEGWRAALGLQYQRVSIRDSDQELSPVDEFGNDLSFGGTGIDDLLILQLSGVRDRRNSATQPTSGSLLRLSTEQSIPIGQGNILLNRLRASYSYYIPVQFTNFTEGPQALAFNVQAGTILGDLPPYEAFSLGGTDSVRGYDSGEVGSGRSFVQATVEYRFPVFSVIGGALFLDVGTDLGTGDDVPGDPAGVRGKPGSGVGFGLGVRIQSPLGPIRVDYGFNDEGEGRLHFGIGERF